MLKGKWAPTSPRLMSGLGSNATCCGFSQRPTFQPFWVCKNQTLQPFTIHFRTSQSDFYVVQKGHLFIWIASHLSLAPLFLRNICTGSLLFFLCADIGQYLPSIMNSNMCNGSLKRLDLENYPFSAVLQNIIYSHICDWSKIIWECLLRCPKYSQVNQYARYGKSLSQWLGGAWK